MWRNHVDTMNGHWTLSGTLPPEYGYLNKLVYFNASGNALSGAPRLLWNVF